MTLILGSDWLKMTESAEPILEEMGREKSLSVQDRVEYLEI